MITLRSKNFHPPIFIKYNNRHWLISNARTESAALGNRREFLKEKNSIKATLLKIQT